MCDKPDGGLAFPGSRQEIVDLTDDTKSSQMVTYSGMSVRTWLAGQAIAGIMGNVSQDDSTCEESAKEACRQADALIAELGK